MLERMSKNNSDSNQKKTVNVSKMIDDKKSKKSLSNFNEKFIPALLLVFALISAAVTIGIVLTLLVEAIQFFRIVPIWDFFTGTEIEPLAQDPQYGILPLLMGTIVSTVIAMIVAGPFGLMSAIYLSEYASNKVRKVLKPLIEILAGIPTIVYGFFAFTFVTPLIRSIWPQVEPTNVLSAGLVMGVMIIPMIASLSEDAMSAVPNEMRQGSLAMGATKLETTFKVVIPAALSGIIAAFVLGISRAIGETMIVTIASGSTANMTLDVTQSMQTMTSYIVNVSGGEAAPGTAQYYSLYAVGLTLFVFTLIMNLLASYISRKFREEY